MADIESTKKQIESEITVDQNGIGFATIRGTARIVDVPESTLRGQLTGAGKKPGRLSKILAEYGFDAREFAKTGVPDTAVSIIAKYYAWLAGSKCTEQAKQIDFAFGAIGARMWMQQVVGWKPTANRKLSNEEIAEICLLTTGRDWKKRFGDSYYDEMSKLTGLKQEGYKRPALWGSLTDEWVYKMLPPGVRDGVRQARIENDGWNKLHQFLSDDGLAVFEKHMDTLLTLMKAADCVNDVRRSLHNMTRSDYQCRLFEDCRKDGKLTLSRQLHLLSEP